MIRLTIDGTEVVTRQGRTILEAAREGGIDIPTLCHHERLTPTGACRLCVVEVAGCDQPIASCQTKATDGISVTTRSERLLALRREILKLILAAHPLDCPRCDRGGECRLQDLAYGLGIESAPYTAARQEHAAIYATPLIRYWELRCVVCGRCVQGCREVSGREAIAIAGRGFEARVVPTDRDDCISCGECLALCPVGALTETQSPLKARRWQGERVDTACPHCGFGCRLRLDVVDGKTITNVTAGPERPPNLGSLCVRGRFGYDFANHEARLSSPLDRTRGGERRVDRATALAIAAENLRKLADAGRQIGLIVSARATCEEMFLIDRIAARLPGARVASAACYHSGRVAARFARNGIAPGYRYERLARCRTIVVAGAELLESNHLLANRVREAVRVNGARVIVVDPLPGALTRIADAHLRVAPGQDAALFDALSLRLLQAGTYDREAETLAGFGEWRRSLAAAAAPRAAATPLPPPPGGVDATMFEKALRLLGEAGETAVIFGSGITHEERSLRALVHFGLLLGGGRQGLLMPVALQANAAGAVAVLREMATPEQLLFDPAVCGLFVYEDDPFGYLNGARLREALAGKSFVAACDLFPSPLCEHAHLVVPAASFAEKEGFFISGNGDASVLSPVSGGGTGDEFLRELLARLGGRRYAGVAEIRDALAATGVGLQGPAASGGRARFDVAAAEPAAPPPSPPGDGPFWLLLRDRFLNHHLCGGGAASVPPYAAGISRVQADRLNIAAEDAARLGVADGGQVRIESAHGAVTGSVTVRAGIRGGVLECVLGHTPGDGLSIRGGILSLSPDPFQGIAVSVRRA